MHGQERWSILLLCLVLLAPVLVPAAQKQEQDKATSPARNPVEGAKIFRYYCAACHGADEGMDQHQLP
jgi:mono/diheme cytochrome c family protein